MLSTTCFASEIKVTIDDKNIEFDVPPIITEGRTMVPMRKIFEELGCTVEWLGESQTIIATQNSKIIVLKIDNTKILSSDVSTGKTDTLQTDVAPMLHNGRTLIPVRAVSEALGCTVDWDPEVQTVIIKS